MKDDKKLIELEQQRERDKQILQDNMNANDNWELSKYSSEQVERAQEQSAKKAINELYNGKVLPYTNAIVYLVYYVASLIVLPFVFCNNTKIPALVFWGILVVGAGILALIEKWCRRSITKESQAIKDLIRFEDHTSMFCCMLTSIGYLVSMMTLPVFWFIYAIMVFLFVVNIIFDVIVPIINRIRNN